MTWESLLEIIAGPVGLMSGFAVALLIVAALGYWETRR